MRVSWVRLVALPGLATAIVLVGGGGAVARAAGPLAWSSPVLVDHQRPYRSRGSLDAISCPSVRLCVAVDDAGGVAVSRHPGGAVPSWRQVSFRGAMMLGVSCPSITLCVAADDEGNVSVSRTPSHHAWSVVRVDRSEGLLGVSCASVSLCVAFDTVRLFVSTNPGSRAARWKAVRIEPPETACQPGFGVSCPQQVTAVSCASPSFCAAVDNFGYVITSIRPDGGRTAWQSVHVDQAPFSPTHCLTTCSALLAISCPSRSLCVAGDSAGNLLLSAHPTADSSAWRSWYATPPGCAGCSRYPVRAISCPTVRFCAALDDWGNTIVSTHPARGRRAWRLTRAPADLPGTVYHTSAFACPSSALCVALRNPVASDPVGSPATSNALVSTRPLGGTSTWRLASIPTAGYNRLHVIACPSASLCIAADNAGHVITSTRPRGGVHAWRLTNLMGSVVALSCPSVSFCAAVDASGHVLISHRPAHGAHAWTRIAGPSRHRLGGISCPTSSLCVGFSGATILTTSDPAAGAKAWTAQLSASATDPECGKYGPPANCSIPAPISSVLCVSAHLCLALDAYGDLLSSTDPAGGSGAWRTRPLDPACDGSCPDTISCSSVVFCVVSGSSVFTSQRPENGEWTTAAPTAPTRVSPLVLSAQSCPSAQLCVGINGRGDLLVSTDSARTWTTSTIAHHGFIDPFYYGFSITLGPTSVSCPAPSLCVSVDAFGNVIATTGGGG